MAFKEVSDTDTTIALGGVNKKTGKPNPTTITGYFLGTKEIKTDYGPAQLHTLKTENGNTGVWGKTDLNKKMTSVPYGALVRITQTGMQKMPGKNPMYKYKVEIDDSDMLDAGPELSAEEENEQNFPSQIEEDYEESAVDSDEEHMDEVVTTSIRKATPPVNAERAQKVKSLLNKSRTA